MRSRVVWVHAVDLATGVTFADIPDDVLAALVDDVFTSWDRRDAVPHITVPRRRPPIRSRLAGRRRDHARAHGPG